MERHLVPVSEVQPAPLFREYGIIAHGRQHININKFNYLFDVYM